MSYPFSLTAHYQKDIQLVDIFGVILYTDAHPHVKKVLADEDYWRAIDEVSGPKWAVFSIKPNQGHFELPSSQPGALSFLVPVWKEPNDNKQILQDFGIMSTKDLPLLLVFTRGARDEILKLSLNIKDENVELAYTSLRKAIEIVTRAVDQIDPKYLKNSEGVFYAVDMAVGDFKKWELFRKGIDLFLWIKKFLP